MFRVHRNFLFIIIFLILIGTALGAGCTSPATSPASVPTGAPAALDPAVAIIAEYPAPGELVQVNGSRMHIRCEGSGSPTVVMEAGSTDISLSWARVQPPVAGFTRVCSYDRLGYGWSDPMSGPITARGVTERLHTLLASANISPPIILVGHSLGGEYVRDYAHRYPYEVAGIVLVDPGSEWQMTRTGGNFTQQQKTAIASAVVGLRTNEQLAANGTFVRNLSLVPVDPRLPSYEFHAYQALLATRPQFWEARALEAESGFPIFDELQRENISSLGDIPLVVISSGNEMGFSQDPIENAYANTVFRTLQKEMAQESPDGMYLVAPNTSHYVQLDRPEVVIDAIRSVVNATRHQSET